MEYRTLGRTDLKVSSIGLGGVTFGREIDRDASFAVLDHACARGINLLDTAEAYGEGVSEQILGQWLAQCGLRNRLVVMTKLLPPLTAAHIVAATEASLRRLRMECVDILMLHQWDAATPLEETLPALDRLVRDGKARYVGCSNFAAAQLRAALAIQKAQRLARMEAVEPIYNLVHRGIESDLLPLCSQEQIGVITYSPLGAGFLTGKYTPDGPVPTGSRFAIKPGHQPIYFSERGFAILADLRAQSERTGRSMIELALGWVFRQPGITSVLIGARHAGHIDQAFAAEAPNP